jgi:hypothetical protein
MNDEPTKPMTYTEANLPPMFPAARIMPADCMRRGEMYPESNTYPSQPVEEK